jgi:hypothetical protein
MRTSSDLLSPQSSSSSLDSSQASDDDLLSTPEDATTPFAHLFLHSDHFSLTAASPPLDARRLAPGTRSVSSPHFLNVDAPAFTPVVAKLPAGTASPTFSNSSLSLDGERDEDRDFDRDEDEEEEGTLTPAMIKHALPNWMCSEVVQMKMRKTRRGCRGHRRNRKQRAATAADPLEASPAPTA